MKRNERCELLPSPGMVPGEPIGTDYHIHLGVAYRWAHKLDAEMVRSLIRRLEVAERNMPTADGLRELHQREWCLQFLLTHEAILD